MSQIAVESFLGRIITDETFRRQAEASLEQTCLSFGFSISAEEMICLKSLQFKLFGLIAETIDEAVRRS